MKKKYFIFGGILIASISAILFFQNAGRANPGNHCQILPGYTPNVVCNAAQNGGYLYFSSTGSCRLASANSSPSVSMNCPVGNHYFLYSETWRPDNGGWWNWFYVSSYSQTVVVQDSNPNTPPPTVSCSAWTLRACETRCNCAGDCERISGRGKYVCTR